jgi:hypothetical protein
MDISITTPALLFPAISLLLLAYTQRFLTLATLIRDLHRQFTLDAGAHIPPQIDNLRKRVYIIRDMQGLGIGSLFLCVLSMFLIYAGRDQLASYVFATSLIFMMASLGLMIREIALSVGALEFVLGDFTQSSAKSKGD